MPRDSSRPSFVLKNRALAIALPFIAGTLAMTPSAHAKAEQAPNPPRPWLQQKVEQARDLSQRKVKAGSPEAERLEGEVRDLINEMLDWDELTRRSLGSEWNKRTPEQQAEFSKILREMIEASYQSKLKVASRGKGRQPKEVTIDWAEEEVRGGQAKVAALVKADKTKVLLEFSLIWKKGRWQVYDLAIDDVSTVRTYRSQFRKLIADDGFPALLVRMRKKADDIRTGRGDLATAIE